MIIILSYHQHTHTHEICFYIIPSIKHTHTLWFFLFLLTINKTQRLFLLINFYIHTISHTHTRHLYHKTHTYRFLFPSTHTQTFWGIFYTNQTHIHTFWGDFSMFLVISFEPSTKHIHTSERETMGILPGDSFVFINIITHTHRFFKYCIINQTHTHEREMFLDFSCFC